MPTYRQLRPGDLLAVRTTDPHDPEWQVVLHAVVDNGATVLYSGAWQGKDLEILARRVGDTAPLRDDH